jgi:hypothetical protein
MKGNSESDWCTAGIQSSKGFPIDRIITSSKQKPLPKTGSTAGDFVLKKFWAPYKNPRIVHRNIRAQEQALRAICAHADWMIIRMPQLRGDDTGEEVTVKQILEIASSRPKGFSDLEIHLDTQTKKPRIPDKRLIGNIRQHLQDSIGVNTKLHINVCSNVLNRELLAGKFKKTSDGVLLRDALWLITMTHVAVRSQQHSNDNSNKWLLESRTEAHERLRELEAEAS